MLSSVKSSNSLVLYALTTLYLILSLYAIVNGFLFLLLLPIVLGVIYLAVERIDKVFLLLGLLTPLSINLAKTGLGIGVSLPAEPLIFGLMLLFLLKTLYEGGVERKILYHPVSLAIIFHLFWMMVTTLSSTMFMVSFKQFLARAAFVSVFFFLGIQVFRNLRNIRAFIWTYIITFTIVIAYTLFNHASAGFTEKAAHTSMVPFYNDHTAYAAAAAMYVPLLIAFIFDKGYKTMNRWISGGFFIIFITSLILSYTRASWVSLIAAMLCYFVFLFKIRTWVVVAMIFTVVSGYLVYQSDITMALERNEEQSSTDYASHVQSASNITTDASNVERLNRWSSAWRMFLEKPVLGWGPGTYMFQYAPFQKTDEKTIISTNFGEGGNAHSEYIGPLAEQGVLGTLGFILIGVFVILRASKFIKNCNDPRLKVLAKGLILGLITYWVHGMLNNFLDTDKASLPFWGFMGALVALELFHDHEGPEVNQTVK
jgi:O-antigen ligase